MWPPLLLLWQVKPSQVVTEKLVAPMGDARDIGAASPLLPLPARYAAALEGMPSTSRSCTNCPFCPCTSPTPTPMPSMPPILHARPSCV